MFEDRARAGKKLAEKLKEYRKKNAIVLALPRGGVIVAHEVSKRLNLPLSVIVSRKIGAPANPEYALGAVSEKGAKVIDKPAVFNQDVSSEELDVLVENEKKEVERRVKMYRNKKPLPDLENKIVLLIDDGLATGMTALAALKVIKLQNPQKVIFASPVCSEHTASLFSSILDGVVCFMTPPDLGAIGAYYKNFKQVTDKEVISVLSEYSPSQPKTK